MPIQPYLFFDGRADESIEFYRKALGAEVRMLMRFKESPAPPYSCQIRQCAPSPSSSVLSRSATG